MPSIAASYPFSIKLIGAAFLALLTAGLFLDTILLQRILRGELQWLRRRLEVLRTRPWKAADAMLILVVFFTLNVGLGAGLSVAHRLGLAYEHMAAWSIVLQSLVVPLACISVALRLMRRRGLSWQDAFGLSAADWRAQVRRGFLFYVASIPPIFGASLVYMAVLLRLGFPVDSQDVIRLLADRSQPVWLQAYIAVVAVGLAPVVEEILFRGIALPGLLKLSRPWSAVVLVSIIFAYFHMHIPSFVPLFLLAVSFSLAYAASGSLLTAMVMHATFNATSLTVLLTLRDTLHLAAAP